MRRTSFLQAIGPLLIIAVGVTAFTWLRSLRAPPKTKPPDSRPTPVRTLVLGPPRVQFNILVGGRVVPRREVTLSAEVAGRVVARPADVRAGRHVAGTSLLLQLDPGDYELQLRSIDTQIHGIDLDLQRLTTETAGIDALVELARKDLELATNEFERIESLLEKKTATLADRDRAERGELAARNALQTLENQRDLLPIHRRQLLSRREGLVTQQKRAQRNLQRTRILAPFDGLLTLAETEVGDFVQPGDVVMKIEETAAVEVECRLRADDLHWIKDTVAPRDPNFGTRNPFEVPRILVMVSYRDSNRTHQWTGRLTRFVGQGVDPRTRTVPCRVVVSQAEAVGVHDAATVLMRGMYVTLTLPVSPTTRLIEIPAEAVRPNHQVWSVRDNQLVIHQLEIARVLTDSVLVRADQVTLQPGDHVIVSPLKIAYDGMRVRQRSGKTPDGQPADGSQSP